MPDLNVDYAQYLPPLGTFLNYYSLITKIFNCEKKDTISAIINNQDYKIMIGYGNITLIESSKFCEPIKNKKIDLINKILAEKESKNKKFDDYFIY
ncbi:MAG: hypothetical protein PHN56_04360 [Candidatus Nanoarchaeia archaeon]|nr:hypothetical protein [Candidatus Nanoarchaeia archaeon]